MTMNISLYKKTGIALTLYLILSVSAHAAVNVGNNNTNVTGTASVVGNNNNAGGSLNGVIIGNNGTLTNSDNGIVLGAGSVKDGDGISIGGGVSSNGGIALGSGSSASRADELNVGDRQITGVKDGVANSDAANVGQLNTAANNTLNSANTYTDNQATNVLNESKTYTDSSATNTLNSANTYTDNKATNVLNESKTYTDNSATNTLNSANTYTDNQAVNVLNESKTYTDNAISNGFNDYYQQSKDHINNRANSLDKKINKNMKKANAGIGGAMAMSSIPEKYGYDFSAGIAIANYRDGQALAAGAKYDVSAKAATKFNISVDTQGGVGIGAGLAFGIE
jgi:adhesin YadB/C